MNKTSNSKRFRKLDIIPIENFGNTCYVNSFLQFIIHSNIMKLILQINTTNTTISQLKLIINDYIFKSRVLKESIFVLTKLLEFLPNTQYDVYDIIDITLKSFNEYVNTNEFNLSYILNIKCMECNYSVFKNHKMSILNINNNNISDIENNYISSRSKYMCYECKCESEHLKTYSNIETPNNLIIHIIKQGNDATNYYPSFFTLNNENFELQNTINRIHFNNNSGHYYNTIIHNHKDIKLVSDDKITNLNNYYDENTLFLIYSKVNSHIEMRSDIELLFFDKSKNRIQCPKCQKSISRKHIQQHVGNMHDIKNFSLKDYKIIETILQEKPSKIPKQKCILCGKLYSVRHINEHYEKCKIKINKSIISGSKCPLEIEENNPKEINELVINNTASEIIETGETDNEKTNKQLKKYNEINQQLHQDPSDITKKRLSINKSKFRNQKEQKLRKEGTNKHIKRIYKYNKKETRDTNLKRQKVMIGYIENKINKYKWEYGNNIFRSHKTSDDYQINLSTTNEQMSSSDTFNININSRFYEHNNIIIPQINQKNEANKKINCPECTKQICNKGIRNHFLIYHPHRLKEFQYKCNINGCELSYNTKNSLSHHQRNNHTNDYLKEKLKTIDNNNQINIDINKTEKRKRTDSHEPKPNGLSKRRRSNNTIEELTKMNKSEFLIGKLKPIPILDNCPLLKTSKKLIIPNNELNVRVFQKVTKELLKKYGVIIGELPTNKLTKNNQKYKDNKAINNIFNNLIKDFILITERTTLKFNKYKSIKDAKKRKKYDVLEDMTEEINQNNWYKVADTLRNKLKSSDRIRIYSELRKNNMNIKYVNRWNGEEKEKMISILQEIISFNLNKRKEKNNNLNEKFNTEYEFKNYINKNILNNNERKCEIKKEKLYNEFRNNFNSEKEKSISNSIKLPIWWDIIKESFPNDDEINLNEVIDYKFITMKEFNNILSSMKGSSAPGPDGINYGLIKQCFGFKLLINKLMNSFLYYNTLPDSFNSSITKLLDKNKENPNDINNWRPICLQNSISKILSKWITTKIYNIHSMLKSKNKPIFSNEQKGFKFNEYGCEEHNNTLRSIYEDVKRNIDSTTHEVTTLMIDFENAFTNINHDIIHRMLNMFHIPNTLKNIILQYYMKAYTIIKTNRNEYTNKIFIKKGVRQGDPLSPLLFNMCIEPLIRLIKSTKIGYKFKGNKELMVNIMAYADDILITTNSIQEMEILFNKLGDYCRWANININVNKCGSASTFQLPNGEIGQKVTHFTINNDKIPDIGYNKQMKYLGCYISSKYRDIINSNDNMLYKIKEYIFSLNKSLLNGIDKIKALKQYILPKTEFIMRNSYINIKELEELDTLIALNVKSWLKLPKTLTNDILYLKWYDGGLGIQNITERYRTSKLVSFIKLLNDETYIGDITKYTLLQYEQNRKITKGDGDRKFLDWKITNNKIESVENRTQSISIISKIYNTCSKYKIGLEYDFEKKKIQLQIPYYVDKQMNIYNIINQIFRHHRIQVYNQKKFQSYKSTIMLNKKDDNRILKNLNKINDNLLRNLIIARTNTFPTKYNTNIWNKNNSNNLYCTLNGCENKIHNISHILQSCVSKRPIYLNRHNNVSTILCQHLKRQNKYEIHQDKNQYGIIEKIDKEEIMKQRPDIVLVDREKRNIIVLEIAFINYINQYDNMINEIKEFKINKYKKLKELYIENGYTANIFPLIFESTGFIFKITKETIIELFKHMNIKISIRKLFDKMENDIIWNLSRILNIERKILKME